MKCNTTYYPKCTPPQQLWAIIRVQVLVCSFVIPAALADIPHSPTKFTEEVICLFYLLYLKRIKLVLHVSCIIITMDLYTKQGRIPNVLVMTVRRIDVH